MLILIAEDNPDNRALLKRRLERAGHKVAIAVDGIEALEQCQALRPDLILMDVAMPRMTGLVATRQLRANPATTNVAIIAVTAHAMDANRIECLEAGCNDFVTKPIDFTELFAKIEMLIGGARSGIAV